VSRAHDSRSQPRRARRGRSRAAAPSAEPTPRTRRVLFASMAAGLPTAALRRAGALAELLDAELHVLRVLPDRGRSSALFSRRQSAESLASARLQVSVVRRTRRWCASVLSRPLSEGRVRVRHGELGQVAATCISEIGAELVVMPARDGRDGALVTRIAAAARVPVLVARRAAAGEGVVVATDLSDPRCPLLHRGVELAERLGAPVTFVHNVPPPEPEIPVGLGLALPLADPVAAPTPRSALLARRLGRLRAEAARIHPAAESVVVSRPVTTTAILDVSREREADVVVVGTRGRSWLSRLAAPSVARRVVERAARSVLVVPVDGPRGREPDA